MDKPQYVNAFTVSFNQKLREVVLGFAQEYPKAEFSPTQDGGQSPIAVSTIREDICGIVIPEEIARQLIDVLAKTLSSPQNESDVH